MQQLQAAKLQRSVLHVVERLATADQHQDKTIRAAHPLHSGPLAGRAGSRRAALFQVGRS
jgi:hypothetical protein